MDKVPLNRSRFIAHQKLLRHQNNIIIIIISIPQLEIIEYCKRVVIISQLYSADYNLYKIKIKILIQV